MPFSAYLFATIPCITRLKILTAVDNIGSRKLAEKCGYIQEGIMRNAYFYRRNLCDWVIYAMLREECPSLEVLLESGNTPNGGNDTPQDDVDQQCV